MKFLKRKQIAEKQKHQKLYPEEETCLKNTQDISKTCFVHFGWEVQHLKTSQEKKPIDTKYFLEILDIKWKSESRP